MNFSVPSDLWSLLFGSKISSMYVQPHIGGDIPLLAGMAKVLLERRLVNKPFIKTATEGYEQFVQGVNALEWDEIERQSGVSRQQIEELALAYGRAKNAVFGWTMGITHHLHGVENVRMIINLALMRGMLGKPHAGLLPIRGHSNVQGIGSMGVTPNLKQQIFDNIESLLKVKLPTTPGLDTMACMRAAAEGEVTGAICLGGNLFGSNPDAHYAHKALGNLDFITYINTTLNTGHAWGTARETLILPCLARDEEPQPTTQESMFNYVRLSDGGQQRIAQARSEHEILTTLAHRVLGDDGPVNWTELKLHKSVREIIARVIPGMRPLRRSIRRSRSSRSETGRSTRRSFRLPVQGAVFRCRGGHAAAGRRRRAAGDRAGAACRADDDDPFRRAVQYGGLRRAGHLSRPGPAGCDPDAR